MLSRKFELGVGAGNDAVGCMGLLAMVLKLEHTPELLGWLVKTQIAEPDHQRT